MSFKKNLEDLGFVPRFSDINDTGFLNTDYYYFIKRSTLSRAEICLEILRSNSTKMKISIFNGNEQIKQTSEKSFDTFNNFNGTIKNENDLKTILRYLNYENFI